MPITSYLVKEKSKHFTSRTVFGGIFTKDSVLKYWKTLKQKLEVTFKKIYGMFGMTSVDIPLVDNS